MPSLLEWMTSTCIVCIQHGRSMLFTKNLELDGSVFYEPQETLAKPHFKWTTEIAGKDVKFLLDDVFGTHVKWQNSYDYFNFIPYLLEEQKQAISPRLFNTFSGFRWAYTKRSYPQHDGLPVPPDSIKPWIDHIKNTLCKPG